MLLFLKRNLLLGLFSSLFFTSLYAYPPKGFRLPYDAEIALAFQYYNRAETFNELATYDSAVHYYKEAARIFKKKNSGLNHVISLRAIGKKYEDVANYKMCKWYLNKALLAAQQYDLPVEQANTYHNLGRYYFINGKYLESVTGFQKALELRLKLLGENHPIVAVSYNNLGTSYFGLGKHTQSEKYHKKALRIQLKILDPNHQDIAASYNNLGFLYHQIGNYTKALPYYLTGKDIMLKTLGLKHQNVAVCYNNIGGCYESLGDYDKAYGFYQRALKIRLKLFGESHPEAAQSYQNIGNYYHNIGNYKRTLFYYKKAKDILLNIFGSNHPYVAISYNNLGSCYDNKGDHEKAASYHHKALKIRLKVLGSNQLGTATSYNNLGLCYSSQGDYTKAKYYHRKALQIRINLVGENNPITATSYNNLGLCYSSQNEYKKAEYYHHKALQIRIKLMGENNPQTAKSFDNLGTCYSDLGDFKKAEFLYLKTLKIRLNTLGRYNTYSVRSYYILSRLYERQKMLMSSMLYCQKAISASLKGFSDSTNIYTTPPLKNIVSKSWLLRALQQKTRSVEKLYFQSRKLNDLNLSFNTSLLAADLIDSIRNEFETEKAKLQLAQESLSDVYETGLRTGLKLYKKSRKKRYMHQAFNLVERSKSYLLLQSLKDNEAKNFVGLSDTLLEQERDLKIQISFYEKKRLEAESNQDSVKLAMYQNYLFDNKRTYDSLIKTFEKDYPEYYRLKYDTRVASIEDIQKTITDEHTAFLEYFAGDSAVYVFTVTRDTVHIEEVPNPAEIKKSVSELLSLIKNHPQSLSDYEKVKENEQQRIKTSLSLYDRLLSSSLKKLNKNIKKLVIVPDGMLNYLPFEALLTSNTTIPHYVLEDYAISYGYSGTLLSEKIKVPSRRAAEGEVLALAPRYPGNSKKLAVRGEINTLRSQPLSDLPGARKEVKSISDYFDGEFLFGAAASEQNFKERAPHYNILHLAMHGKAEAGSKLNAKLLFTPTKSKTEDDTLYNYELYGLKLNADLIVLSACETGTGDLLKGEGVMSLARGFMYAGAQSVVSSLWQTSDEAGSKLMHYFYEHLSKGQSKDEALQEAKKRYLQETKDNNDHPFYWAAFIPIGDMKPVQIKKNYNPSMWWSILGAGFLIGIGLYLRKVKYRR